MKPESDHFEMQYFTRTVVSVREAARELRICDMYHHLSEIYCIQIHTPSRAIRDRCSSVLSEYSWSNPLERLS